MTRARYVTHSQTVARLAKLRTLITTLQERQLRRDEIGNILQVGPSGVRKYLADLRDLVATVFDAGVAVCRLVAAAEKVQAFLAGLGAMAPGRPAAAPPPSPDRIAARDPGRHFHILADDEHYSIRVSQAAPARDWAVAALFGAGPAGMGACA